jgi:hypothetical protein
MSAKKGSKKIAGGRRGAGSTLIVKTAAAPRVKASHRASAVKLSWRFLHQSPFDGKKWGDPAIYATPRTVESLVRETAQNSLDAGAGAKITMRYRLYEVPASSNRYKQMMKALRYDEELRPHLQAAASAADTRDIGNRIKSGLEAMSAVSRPLRILTIEDFGGKGLSGDEFASESPFAALVRDVSNSQKSDQTAGGSFGLGSRTLFGASRLMTVLFGSVIAGEDESKVRLIGKSDLSYHQLKGKAGQEYAGRGWMGSPVGDDGAHSVRIDRSESILSDLLVSRELPAEEKRAIGTTAVILAFSEAKADEQTGQEVVDRIIRAVAQSFWPSVTIGQLSVEVEHYLGDEVSPTSSRKVDPKDFVPSLIEAFDKHRKGDLVDKLVNAGDTVSEPIELVIPATSPLGGVDPQHPETTAECRLVIRLADHECADKNLCDHVGYTRGRGMITQYSPRRNLAAGARPYHAVLLCGTLAGKGSPENAAERFLRFAEPPAHDKWEVENLGSRYERGGGKRLSELDERVREALRKHVCSEPSESDDGPDVLKEIFKLRKLPNPPEPGVKISGAKAPFKSGFYNVQATISPVRDGACRIEPVLSIVKEQGVAIKTEWVDLSSPDAVLVDGAFVLTPSTKRIRITGRAQVLQPGLDPERCVVQLSASYVSVGASK